MNTSKFFMKATGIIFTFSVVIFAGNTEQITELSKTKIENQTIEVTNNQKIDKVSKAFIDYMDMIEKKYPNRDKVDQDKFYEIHGEKIALLYCKAIGINGPCVLNEKESAFIPLKKNTEIKNFSGKRWGWFDWITKFWSNIAVPTGNSTCAYNSTLIQIYMDDEDRRNANSHWGWIGATSQGNNTLWKFCRLNSIDSLSFKKLRNDDYAVLKSGLFCPNGSTTLIRNQSNEIRRNNNWHSGRMFPNIQWWHNTTTFYCVFKKNQQNYMQDFPSLDFSYGVFGRLSYEHSLGHGHVYQDDEDRWYGNYNLWIGQRPSSIMGGGRNTWRNLTKVSY